MSATATKLFAPLLDRARDAIAAGDAHYRQAAELIAKAQAAGATQQQIAAGVGRSRRWLKYLLQWRKGGYQGAVFDKSNRSRQRGSQTAHTKKSKPPPTAEQKAKAAERERRSERQHKERLERERTKQRQQEQRSDERMAADRARAAAYEAMNRPAGGHTLPAADRRILVSCLEQVVGSDNEGVRENARQHTARLLKKIGLRFEDLIIPAAQQKERAA
jgi:hypothetical protein